MFILKLCKLMNLHWHGERNNNTEGLQLAQNESIQICFIELRNVG